MWALVPGNTHDRSLFLTPQKSTMALRGTAEMDSWSVARAKERGPDRSCRPVRQQDVTGRCLNGPDLTPRLSTSCPAGRIDDCRRHINNRVASLLTSRKYRCPTNLSSELVTRMPACHCSELRRSQSSLTAELSSCLNYGCCTLITRSLILELISWQR